VNNKTLASELLKFGGHKIGCARRQWTALPCSCGWEKAEKLAMEIVYPPKRIAGCVCDVRTWGMEDIPLVCNQYVGDGICSCETCKHDKECHQ